MCIRDRYNPYCFACTLRNPFWLGFLLINILKCYLCSLKIVKEKMEIVLKKKIKEAVQTIYNSEVKDDLIQIQETRKDFKGDFTLVVFPLLRFSKNTPEKTGETIGQYLKDNFAAVAGFNVIKGFLNLEISDAWWVEYFKKIAAEKTHLENCKV